MIKLSKISVREQLLVLATTTMIVGGLYVGFRYYPAHKAIGETEKNTEMMITAMKTTAIPEEPYDDTNTLKSEIKDLEIALAEANQLNAGIESRLSQGDTTATRLAISDVARYAKVRFITNEEYRVTVPVPVGATASANTPVKAKKRLGDAAQRRARNERRAVRLAGATLSINQISPDQASPLIRKMAINGPMERPMQRVVMEGTYAGLVEFIRGLGEMEMMVTIVQFQIMPTPQTPPQGYNQRLSATMVLAL